MDKIIPMTKEGYEVLLKELDRLKRVERPKIVEEIAKARAYGDLSENAEYEAAKERQSFIEGKIRDLEDRLARASIIDTSKLSGDKVVFGATVRLQDIDSGKEIQYKIVGADEANPSKGRISVASPLARALIGQKLKDLVKVEVPSGIKEYLVLDINFE